MCVRYIGKNVEKTILTYFKVLYRHGFGVTEVISENLTTSGLWFDIRPRDLAYERGMLTTPPRLSVVVGVTLLYCVRELTGYNAGCNTSFFVGVSFVVHRPSWQMLP
jgi:hypothetical protein